VRVGLNLLHLVPGETGGSELYARRLVPALLERGADLTLFVSQLAVTSLEEEPWANDVVLTPIRVDSRSRARRVLAEQTLLPRAAARAKVELLHNLFTTAPILPRLPQVTTIHDVIYKRFPETHTGLLRWGMEVLVPLAARRSKRVITISEAAKQDIVRFLGVRPSVVDVTYEGPGLPSVEPIDRDTLRSRLGVSDTRIVLSVSAKRPHKNLERLFQALARVRSSPGVVLVVPGYETYYEETLRQSAAVLGDRVRFTGWIDDQTLEALYREAEFLVFPSLAEGFGLPVLDALVRGTPVACSNASSLPEVAGDAALYFDPLDVDAIASAIDRLLSDSELRVRLSHAGLEQARKFSWEKTAERTLASYERALAAD
jgi:glycosyltransferase involved in cell wall biosynthesis